MSPADLSIVAIIPLYNGARWIEQSIRSVLAQTLMPDEFIVVDDGSTDDGAGAAIVERLRQNYPLITLLRKPNGGQSSARNFAAANSTSELIALLDQDDLWYPHHLEQLIKPFRDNLGIPLGWTYSNLDIIDESGGCVQHAYLDTIPVNQPKRSLAICLSQDMHVLPSGSLIAREAFEAVGGFDEHLSGYEDDDLFLRIFRAGYDNVYLNERLCKWRLYSTSTSYTDRMAISRMIYARKLLEMLPDDPRRGLFWGRDYIIPRFMRVLKGEYQRCRNSGDLEQAARFLAEMEEIAGRDYIIPRLMDTLKGEYQRCRKSGDLEQAARFLAEMEEIGSHLPEKTRVKLYINMLGIPIRATGRVPRKWAIHTFARFKNSELGRQG
jgi:glycosyltransferase involved in cell wall biosynthesis